MWNALKPKDIPALLITAALAVLLSSSAYVLVYRQGGEQMPSSRPADRPDKPARDISPQQQFVAETGDILGVETMRPKPESWLSVTSSKQGLSFAHPPDLISDQGSRDVGVSERPTHSIFLSQSGDGKDGRCSLSSEPVTFAQAKSEYELRDEADDDAITEAPGRLWFNITEKDEFIYEGREAVKYKVYNRISTKHEPRFGVNYMLNQNANTTLTLSCTLYDGIDEATADAMLRQINIQPQP